jgi:DNA-directed RNA polymerase specialized sigma24 family protein
MRPMLGGPVQTDPVQIDPVQIDPVPAGALARAQAGDGQAFQELTDPYRGELQLHCYRILGSLADAEDVMQETLLAAWRGLPQYQGRTSCGPVAGAHARSPAHRRSRRPSRPAGENQCG